MWRSHPGILYETPEILQTYYLKVIHDLLLFGIMITYIDYRKPLGNFIFIMNFKTFVSLILLLIDLLS